MREHLDGHILESTWPRDRPHPLCKVALATEQVCRYHLINVNNLRIDGTDEHAVVEQNKFIEWLPEKTSAKRKRDDTQINVAQTTLLVQIADAAPSVTATITPVLLQTTSEEEDFQEST